MKLSNQCKRKSSANKCTSSKAELSLGVPLRQETGRTYEGQSMPAVKRLQTTLRQIRPSQTCDCEVPPLSNYEDLFEPDNWQRWIHPSLLKVMSAWQKQKETGDTSFACAPLQSCCQNCQLSVIVYLPVRRMHKHTQRCRSGKFRWISGRSTGNLQLPSALR